MSSPTNILDSSSAQTFKLSSGPISARAFIKWVRSSDAAHGGIDHISLHEVLWRKQPGLPSHEYLIMTFIAGGGISVRVERDTDSWRTVIKAKSYSNCKDTFKFSKHAENLTSIGDRTIASLTFTQPSITFLRIATLVELIVNLADDYNVYTLNCWWYASCLWTNLAMCAGLDQTEFRLVDKTDEIQRLASHLAVTEWDALRFAEIQQFVHHAGLRRSGLDRRVGVAMTERLHRVTAEVQSRFEQIGFQLSSWTVVWDLLKLEKQMCLSSLDPRSSLTRARLWRTLCNQFDAHRPHLHLPTTEQGSESGGDGFPSTGQEYLPTLQNLFSVPDQVSPSSGEPFPVTRKDSTVILKYLLSETIVIENQMHLSTEQDWRDCRDLERAKWGGNPASPEEVAMKRLLPLFRQQELGNLTVEQGCWVLGKLVSDGQKLEERMRSVAASWWQLLVKEEELLENFTRARSRQSEVLKDLTRRLSIEKKAIDYTVGRLRGRLPMLRKLLDGCDISEDQVVSLPKHVGIGWSKRLLSKAEGRLLAAERSEGIMLRAQKSIGALQQRTAKLTLGEKHPFVSPSLFPLLTVSTPQIYSSLTTLWTTWLWPGIAVAATISVLHKVSFVVFITIVLCALLHRTLTSSGSTAIWSALALLGGIFVLLGAVFSTFVFTVLQLLAHLFRTGISVLWAWCPFPWHLWGSISVMAGAVIFVSLVVSLSNYPPRFRS